MDVNRKPKRVRYSSHSDPRYLRLLESSRVWKEKNKHTESYKKKKYESDIDYYLRVRDSEEFKGKRLDLQRNYQPNSEVLRNIKRSIRRYRSQHPEVVKAHDAVRTALRRGILVRPSNCSRCGIKPKSRKDGRTGIHAHHHNYAKPLDVVWLCARCHGVTRQVHESRGR